MAPSPVRETDLYGPVKALLEGQGYEVKGEVGAADVAAVRGEEPPVLVELKTKFSLALFHQAIERLAVSETVYVAVPRIEGSGFHKALKQNKALCRRLGLGLITVRLRDGLVEVHCDPGPYRPRISARRQGRLLREFARRVGDPNDGGATRRRALMTAYRQDALRCAQVLAAAGPTKAADVAKATGVAKARAILSDDHYGWFERVERGVYALTPKGAEALEAFATVVAELSEDRPAAAE